MSARFHELRPALPGLEDPRGRLFRESMAQLEWAAWDKSKRQRGWMTRCHGVVLPTGRILLPLYSDGYLAGLMAISDDQGRSWRAGGPIIGPALNQPSVVRRRDGTLVAFMREETFPLADDEQWMRRVFLSESRDEGESWSLAVPTDLPNPNTSLEVLSLRDGRWVLVYNDTERGRHTLAMALSEDEGRSWRWRRRLEHRVGGLFHYPSIIQTRDGRLQVTYTFQPGPDAGRSIKHVSLDPEWIRVEDSDPP
jgi:predicted neuraminidase